jgi:predicted RNA-binding Zn ribbon-like protein
MADALIMAGVKQPGGRRPAPGALALVQQFVNSVDREHGPDLFATPDDLRRWLQERKLITRRDPIGEAERQQAIEAREGLRMLLLANNGAELEPDAIEALNHATRNADTLVRLDDEGLSELVPIRSGLDGALGRIMAIVHRSIADGTWQRFKACPNHVCQWAFYDHSKNQSGTWCSMAICGGRIKRRAYHRRRRAGA